MGDPDVVGTLVRSFEHVSVACVLLGSAEGTPAQLAALHGTRLEMLLARMLDTTVRGIVYEASGSVDRDVLAAGAASCGSAARTPGSRMRCSAPPRRSPRLDGCGGGRRPQHARWRAGRPAIN